MAENNYMNYKFQVLKSSWGIVIFVDINDQLSNNILLNSIKISDNVYLKIEGEMTISSEVVNFWFRKAILDVEDNLREQFNNLKVCFCVTTIEFVHTDFQEEGLYCAILGWLEKRYDIPIPQIKIEYNSERNKYIFIEENGNILKRDLG